MTTRTASRPSRSRLVLPLLADLACTVAFAFGGKTSHEAGESDWVVLAIVWPFALAVAAAHAGLFAKGRRAERVWPEGVTVVAATYVVGIALRAISGRTIALGFLVVALVFLTVTMLGWRALVRSRSRRHEATAQIGD